MRDSTKQPAVWLTSSGIDPEMGGIASVTRSCLAALHRSATDGATATRFIGLRSAPAGSGHGITARDCRGGRLRFLLETTRQVWKRPDVVVHEHVDLAQCQVLLPRRGRRPYLVWGHGIELWRPLPARKERALREADGLLFNSAFTRSRAAEFHPWILDLPYRVVPLCREPAADAGSNVAPNAEESESTEEPPPGILTVGRLVADRPKGHLEILSALPRVVAAVPAAHWHVVGDGPWRDELAEAVAKSPVRDRVTLHGFAPATEMARLHQSCRVFAMPSHGEGFGLVYAEAMARGLPCIGSTRDAAAEVIGDAGTCVDLDDDTALTEALIDHLAADRDRREARSRRARERAEHFTLPRFARDLQQALHDLVGSGG